MVADHVQRLPLRRHPPEAQSFARCV
jgi:hypothetical protein